MTPEEQEVAADLARECYVTAGSVLTGDPDFFAWPDLPRIRESLHAPCLEKAFPRVKAEKSAGAGARSNRKRRRIDWAFAGNSPATSANERGSAGAAGATVPAETVDRQSLSHDNDSIEDRVEYQRNVAGSFCWMISRNDCKRQARVRAMCRFRSRKNKNDLDLLQPIHLEKRFSTQSHCQIRRAT